MNSMPTDLCDSQLAAKKQTQGTMGLAESWVNMSEHASQKVAMFGTV